MIGSQIVARTQITKFLSALIIHCQLGMPLRRQPQNFPWAFSRMPFNANSRNRETSATDLTIPLYKKEEKKRNWKVNVHSHLHFLKSKINMKYLTPWLSHTPGLLYFDQRLFKRGLSKTVWKGSSQSLGFSIRKILILLVSNLPDVLLFQLPTDYWVDLVGGFQITTIWGVGI